MTRRLLIGLAALAIASLGLVACGGDDETDSSTTAAETSSETTAASTGGGTTIAVEADPGGSLAWTSTELSAEAGSDTIEMTNDSSTPHNLLIEDDAGSVLAETDTVSGDTATATVKLEAGSYTFFCDVPGHREAGMEGTLTVK